MIMEQWGIPFSGPAGRDDLISAGVFVASQDGRTKKEWYNSKESVAVCDIKIRTGLSEVL